ncbi:MAG: ROK family protein [Candidatus Limnocylindrales bacterium]
MMVEAAQPLVQARARARESPIGPLVLALDLGASRIRAAVIADDGTVIVRTTRSTPLAQGPEAVLGACASALVTVRRRLPPDVGARVMAVGVAAPGPLDAATGHLLEPPNLGPAFRGLPLGPHLSTTTGLPVAMERDTNVAALAEQAFGSARGCRDFLYLTVSTGIGGAIMADGRLFRGPDGSAGELGHVTVDLDGPRCGCGAAGHLEALASGSGIAALARRSIAAGEAPGLAAFAARAARTQGAAPDAAPDVDARLVAAAEAAGDPTAAAIMERARRAFAAALVSFVDVFTPRLIVIGGSLARAQGERWLRPARDAIATLAFPSAAGRTRVVPAALGDDVGLVGAVPLWRLSRDPLDPPPAAADRPRTLMEVPSL